MNDIDPLIKFFANYKNDEWTKNCKLDLFMIVGGFFNFYDTLFDNFFANKVALKEHGIYFER